MIIVSQDKKTILNFDNSTTIRIYKTSRGYEIDTCLTNGNTSDLGEYATEERAKEVLQEITNTFAIKGVQDATYQYADIWIRMRQYAIYEMPKE